MFKKHFKKIEPGICNKNKSQSSDSKYSYNSIQIDTQGAFMQNTNQYAVRILLSELTHIAPDSLWYSILKKNEVT